MRRNLWPLAAVVLIGLWAWNQFGHHPTDSGPFEHRQDGSTFQNRERRLPAQARGYYREYTVETPGSGDRGARRIVTGGDPPTEYYYTDDHYRSFRRFDPPAQGAAR